MKTLNIECRNCNKYIKVRKKTSTYKCYNCGWEEDLVVISGKGIDKNEYEKK